MRCHAIGSSGGTIGPNLVSLGGSSTPEYILQSLIDPSIRPWRLGATMFTVFGTLSLVIAAVGLYGVVTYDVSQRGHEIGVRMALGAQRRDVLRLVLLDGVRLAAIGIAVGALIGLALSRFVAPLLFETSPRDPIVFGTVVLVLLTAPARAAPRSRSRGLPART